MLLKQKEDSPQQSRALWNVFPTLPPAHCLLPALAGLGGLTITQLSHPHTSRCVKSSTWKECLGPFWPPLLIPPPETELHLPWHLLSIDTTVLGLHPCPLSPMNRWPCRVAVRTKLNTEREGVLKVITCCVNECLLTQGWNVRGCYYHSLSVMSTNAWLVHSVGGYHYYSDCTGGETEAHRGRWGESRGLSKDELTRAVT